MSAIFTDIGFGLCALGFVALAIGLRPDQVATTVPRISLRVAALFMVAWSVAASLAARRDAPDPALAQLLSLSLVGVWIWQLEPYARWQGLPPLLRVALKVSGIAVFAITLSWMVAAARTGWVPAPTLAIVSLLGLGLCVFGLFAIEQLSRNAPVEARPAMRWLGLGIGGILVGELATFAGTLLLGGKTATPGFVRGVAYALCAIAMMRGARLMPRWTLGLSVSRHVVFFASTFTLVGIYLMLMGFASWVLLTYAGGWQWVAQLTFVLLAGVGLVVALFSDGVQQRLKVLISTHFYPQRYDYRAEWMRFTRTMSEDDPAAGVPQRAIRALAQIVGSPRGCLWQREQGHTARFHRAAHWPVSAIAATPDGRSIAADAQLPAYLERTGWLIDLTELAQQPELYGDLQVDAALFDMPPDALIVPLLHIDVLYGWIVLERAAGKGRLDFEDRDLLKIAGRHVAAHLAQLDADARLAQAHQFETYHRMTAFVMHDLKNVAAQLRLTSQNAERHGSNPEFVADTFRTVASAATRMSKLITQLAGGGQDTGTLQTLDLAGCAERAARHCNGMPLPQVVVESRPVVFADPDQLTAVIEHAIRNAQDATPPEGQVRVEVGSIKERPLLAVIDTGSGMDAQFVRERLFRPFDTTKGSRGMGIGAFQIREYLRSLGGEVEVQSEPGKGTRISMLFADRNTLLQRQAG
ncbi:MAG: XrtA/PEP-CTERM system histidine kinase PrsK [Steroidobacteraceae bacterium]